MRYKIKGLVLIAVIVTVAFIIPGFSDTTKYSMAADEAEWSESGGDASEAYTVVEIVPYKGMGEIGYLIDGQEPVDQELMTYGSAGGQLSFLGDAINVYRSYTEGALPASGTPDTGWYLARTYVTQNGYLEYVPGSGADLYSMSANHTTAYERVPDGTGSYQAELPAGITLDNVYNVNEPTNRKNIDAYFVYGTPADTALYSQTIGYIPYSVTKRPDFTGDYDYDSASKRFILNKGKGEYDVIFVSSAGTNVYHMLADYEIVEDNSGNYSYSGTMNYNPQAGGDYNQITNAHTFTYQRWWGGNYRWVQDDSALTKPSNYYEEGNRIWVKGMKVLKAYQYTYKVQLVNNEWFKRMTLGIPSNQASHYPVRVITITPEQLNSPENQHFIDEADLFYINANYNHNNSYIDLYENYSYEGLSLPYNQKYSNNQNNKQANLNFAVHDLDWPTTLKMFNKIAGIGCYKAAVIVDSTYYRDAVGGQGAYDDLQKNITVSYSWNQKGATKCNLAKLYIMIYQRNMIDFYNSFLNPAKTNYLITQVSDAQNRTGTTGSFIRPDSTNPSPTADAAVYWNGNTFLPYGLDADGDMVRFSQNQLVDNGIVNYNITATPTDLTNNVLSLNGSDIFTSKFTQPLNIPDDSVPEATDHFNSMNPDSPSQTQFDLSDITNVITNDGTGYENTGGVSYPDGGDVEGEVPEGPGSDPDTPPADDGSEDSNLRSYIRVLNIEPTADFTSSEAAIRSMLSDFDVQVINMTSTQFNGSLEDINARYDMIYMGRGAGRFNIKGGSTVFNDGTNMNSYIYFKNGDTINLTSGILSSGNRTRYSGNDITAQKKADLEGYLKAGYPVVLDSGLYQLNYNSAKVKSDTNIYSFISGSKGKGNFFNSADYTADEYKFLNKLNLCFNIVRPIIELTAPVLPDKTAVYYPDLGSLILEFKIVPRGSKRSIYTYKAELYLDKNGDGIFDTTEQLSTTSRDGSTWENLQESRKVTYSYKLDMTDMNGAYQWKIAVEREDNTYIRGAVTGYAAHTDTKTINVLQIREDSSDYNLTAKLEDTSSLINTYTSASNLKDYNIVFDSMTVSEFQELYDPAYGGVPFNPADPEATTKLSKYNLLILDNPDTAINNTYNARNNIKYEITKRLGVIFTKDALGYGNQSSYYTGSLLSLSGPDRFTYNFNGRNALTDKGKLNQLLIYNAMTGEGNVTDMISDAAYKAFFVTKTNEGVITKYPYQLNSAIKIAASSYSKDVTADFSQSQRITGWYCLADSGNPVVRNLGLVNESGSIDLFKGTYSSSPNDVKNNYYLFSNGLCFYSGITLNTADKTGNDDEIKLFINTIIAAYKETTGRRISAPPVINITDPVPVIGSDMIPTIVVSEEDIKDNQLPLSFTVTGSSSGMDLLVTYDGDAEPAGTWDDMIYPKDIAGNIGPLININNSDKAVDNNRPGYSYVLNIPEGLLNGTHTLTLTAVNEDNNKVSSTVRIIYVKRPVIEITDPTPLVNGTRQYIYLDIDYQAGLTEEGYLASQAPLRIEFTVKEEGASTALFTLGFSSGADSLTDAGQDDVKLYKVTGGVDVPASPSAANPSGTYAITVPAVFIKDTDSRKLTITAADASGNIGQTSVILLRRSLFKLD